ncbi:class A beta-lactamase [Mucilaginibacter sp. CAU 1740]|uniref:class A beta-lactamase n=1 Tax=Mucilaginibacter sp. CAU 1740 TaxID=3140365 RepID=UPI00325ADA52
MKINPSISFRRVLRCALIITGFCLVADTGFAQIKGHSKMREEIATIAASSKGKVGISIKILESGDTLSYHADARYPMQSVFKFPIAVSILRAVEKGRLNLDDKILVTKKDLRKTVSALLEKYPNGNQKVSIREMLTDMVTLSDNNACDILMRTLGGPQKITADIHGVGVIDIMIVGDETQMNADWSLQYRNWSKPSAQVQLLSVLYQGKLLSASGTKMLINLMEHTFVAPKRIQGLLPSGTVIAHRSGTSGTDEKGLSPATNDVGVITLPNGKHLAIAIFVSDSYLPDDKRDEVVAKIAKAAFDEFVQ